MTASAVRVPRPREVARLFCLAMRDAHDGQRELFLTWLDGHGGHSWERGDADALRMPKASAVALAMWLRAGDGVYLREIW